MCECSRVREIRLVFSDSSSSSSSHGEVYVATNNFQPAKQLTTLHIYAIWHWHCIVLMRLLNNNGLKFYAYTFVIYLIHAHSLTCSFVRLFARHFGLTVVCCCRLHQRREVKTARNEMREIGKGLRELNAANLPLRYYLKQMKGQQRKQASKYTWQTMQRDSEREGGRASEPT